MDDAGLIEAFVAEFTRDEPLMLFREFSLPGGVQPEDVAPLLAEPWHEDADDIHAWATWRPLRVHTPPEALKAFYDVVPGPLPPLYEQLILAYQWAEVAFARYRLLPNFPPSPDGLIKTFRRDAFMFRVLTSNRFVQFGMGPDVNYDPVCFDLSRRAADRDCAIVQLDHEEILIHERVRIVATVATSFRQLVLETIGEGRA
jgi:hypothetical protein